jgi:hypothetical protein
MKDPIKYHKGERQGEFFKINLPSDYEGYLSGNGEGCFAKGLTEEDSSKAQNNLSLKETFNVILCNDSIYLPPLKDGAIIQCETRGNERPILDIKWLNKITKTEIFDIP